MTTKSDDIDPRVASGRALMREGDRALMRYLDGELQPDEARAIERLLASDSTARDKRTGLLLAGDIVREAVEADSRGDSIADEVMGRLDEAAKLPPLEGLDEELDADREPLASPNKLELNASPAAVHRGALPGPGKPANDKLANDKPANDNARVIFTLAAAAAAVALVLFFWGNAEPDGSVAVAPAPEAPSEGQPAEALAPEGHAKAEAPPPSEDPAEVESAPAPVEVAAVDFGSHSGSVFYVAGQNAPTAVVWVMPGDMP